MYQSIHNAHGIRRKAAIGTARGILRVFSNQSPGVIVRSEMLARHLPQSRIVKAFNAIIMDDRENAGRPGHPNAELFLSPATVPPARRSSPNSMTSSASTQWMPVRLPRDGDLSAAGRSAVCP